MNMMIKKIATFLSNMPFMIVPAERNTYEEYLQKGEWL